MTPHERRLLLSIAPNPDPKSDYVVTIEASFLIRLRTEVSVVLRFVPDRDILASDSFDTYLARLSEIDLSGLEAIATTILTDVNDRLVPKWIQVEAATGFAQAVGVHRHAVLAEDRQPRWDNPTLLSRLKTN